MGAAVRSVLAVRLMIALAVVSAGVLLLGLLWAGRRDAMPDDTPGDVVRVGVVQGQSVLGYLQSAQTELAALTNPSAPAAGDTWALVSLAGYVQPGELTALLQDAAAGEVYTRVPLDDAHTQVIRFRAYKLPADVMSGMLDAALARDREQAEYLQLARRLTGDGSSDIRARRAYETAAGTAGAEAAAYRSGCSCVFAAVVRGTPAVLQRVATRPGIRVVDPAPEVHELDRAEFRPPLPEQTGTVPADPSASPAVPTESTGIASRTSAPIMSSPGVPVTSASSTDSGHGPRLSPTASPLHPAVPSASDSNAAQGVPSQFSAAPRVSTGLQFSGPAVAGGITRGRPGGRSAITGTTALGRSDSGPNRVRSVALLRGPSLAP
ncbi:MAG: hypothetical protein ABW046_13075 [Actinoplanes sp.]